jgi:cellulose synthase/poly-beta-1,6-N-acetylglucosamine synthase-like glycosyltransferase
MMQGAPGISVVVAAYNAAATIGDCVAALSNQSVPRTTYEIIVVDDGSTDGTGDIAGSGGAIALRRAHGGTAVARNAGVAAAKGELVLITDADCAPAENWIHEMVAPLSDPGIAGTKGIYRTRQRSLAARFVQLEYEDRYDHTARHRYVDFVDGYAGAFRRRILLASGGYDPRFRYLEDQELSFRLAEAGHRMVYCPTAAVYHRHADSWRAYARKKWIIGYWKTWVLVLHPGKAARDSHTPVSVKVQMLLAVASPLSIGLALVARSLVWLPAAILSAFAVSTVPFILKAWRRDASATWVSLPALYLRAWSLGLGLLAGYVDRLLGRGPLQTEESASSE